MTYPWFESTWQLYLQSLSQQRLHHGILLSAEAGLGVSDFATQLAKHMLCQKQNQMPQACGQCKSCKLFEANTHPDFSSISGEKSIGVDNIRLVIAKLTSSAQLSGNKVLVINQAEIMTEAAANALLKTLEEPTAHTFIILTCHQSHKLLPTIISRCNKLAIAAPTAEQTLLWLEQQLGKKVDSQWLNVLGNSPLEIKQLLAEDINKYSDFIASLKQMVLNQITIKSFVESHLLENINSLQWLQSWLLQRSKKQAHFIPLLQSANETVEKLQRSGANKLLLLNKLCQQIKLTFNQQQ